MTAFKEIPVDGSSFPALIDEEDYPKVSNFKWRLNPKGYVIATYWKGGKMREVLLHRLVLGVSDSSNVDHIHHNKLDNRKLEIRIASSTQNQGNRRKLKPGLSKFKGVCWHKNKRKWIAHLRTKNGLKHLGYFVKETDAAAAYNIAAIEYFGKDFANINII